jgi:hypothetical protein
MIAADANNSTTVTALDLVKIRALILYLDDELANNTSWRFVEQDYVFPNPVNSRYTELEAYNDTDIFDVGLEFTGNEVESIFELYQNISNPFKAGTTVSFNLPESGAVTLRITDVAGRTLKLINLGAVKGMNSVNLTRDELDATGVFYYQLESANHTATMKMIIVD